MLFAVTPLYERGNLLSDKEIEEEVALVGELTTFECPREPGGPMRRMASLHTPAGQLLKPIIEPRFIAMNKLAFALRGLEELQTQRGYVYVLQEWRITEVRDAQNGQPRVAECREGSATTG